MMIEPVIEDRSYRIGEAIVSGVDVPSYWTLKIYEGDMEIICFESTKWTLQGGEAMARLQVLDKLLALDLKAIELLLQHLDGHLGLAVHRGEGKNEVWLNESNGFIATIRAILPRIQESL